MFDQYHPELGFDLGWDFARYGRFLDPGSANADVLAGYTTGKAHFQVAQHKPTRYQAKWLQLRLSAMRRRRIVHADVTPEYLKRIDCDRCVVTLDSMSHSARAETDWSVDRINNDGAYAAGNLMVISTRANRAKGAKTYAEVAKLAQATSTPTESGLTCAEWARLACVMVGSEETVDPHATLAPLLTRIPEDSRAPLYFLFQQFLLFAVRRAANRNHMLKALNGLHPHRFQQERLRLAAERLALLQKTVAYPYDALNDKQIQGVLVNWFTSLPCQSTRGLLRLAEYFGGSQCELTLPASWSLQTSGHFVDDRTGRSARFAKVA
ncbi:hypothetical protein AWB76_04951 [Caballeronia temeraria]|uniref:Uncharacterized protein n=1 Tax=Caballeronia temeraria TaxID=1777137 RepID=A0A158C061_9BURK|nr:hypothetical protein [Caballeronia temeraria]SAK75703.1 hypothetical protein AWB76_04951 [Caballeronia temeraria]